MTQYMSTYMSHWKNATLSVSFCAFSMAAEMDQAPRQTLTIPQKGWSHPAVASDKVSKPKKSAASCVNGLSSSY